MNAMFHVSPASEEFRVKTRKLKVQILISGRGCELRDLVTSRKSLLLNQIHVSEARVTFQN